MTRVCFYLNVWLAGWLIDYNIKYLNKAIDAFRKWRSIWLTMMDTVGRLYNVSLFRFQFVWLSARDHVFKCFHLKRKIFLNDNSSKSSLGVPKEWKNYYWKRKEQNTRFKYYTYYYWFIATNCNNISSSSSLFAWTNKHI